MTPYDVAHVLGGSRWLMEPHAFRALVARAALATPEAIQAAVAAYGDRESGPKMLGDVAVIDACGPITYKNSWFSMYFGGSTIESMQMQFRTALSDPAVRTIVFRWDSPGGSVDMVSEFADEVFAARGQKLIVSVADTMICSAALWIAAQSDQIYVSSSSQVGSVGVFLMHQEISGLLEKAGVKVTLIAHGDHKTDGNAYEPLSDEAKAGIKQEVDDVGDEFDLAMARGRGVAKKVVLETFGQGKVFRGKKGVAAGLADKLGTFAQVVAKLTKGRTGTGMRAETDAPALAAEVPVVDEIAAALLAAQAVSDEDEPLARRLSRL